VLKILVVVLLISLAVGFVTGGRISGLGRLRFRALPLLYVALVLGLIPLFVSMGHVGSRVFVALGYVALAAFLLVNLTLVSRTIRIGVLLLCLGWILNALPFVANGGMPLSLHAYALAGIRDTPTPSRGGFFKIVIAHHGTHFRFLGDVIPIRVIQQVVSAGDIALALGVAWVIIAAMHEREVVTEGRSR